MFHGDGLCWHLLVMFNGGVCACVIAPCGDGV